MNSKEKILIVDDDLQIVQELQSHLESQGYEVASAKDGLSGLELSRSMLPDMIVLDIAFPVSSLSRNQVVDGVEVLRKLRESGNVPILMLSSTNISAVRVMALNMGADDYVSKPFELQELSARIEAILRRARQAATEERILNFRRLRLDPGERNVWKDNQPIQLTGFEFDILYMLARRPIHVFTRDNIIEQVWKIDSCCVPKAVDVHIGHIRQKIEDDPKSPSFIVTVRGTGYRFKDEPV